METVIYEGKVGTNPAHEKLLSQGKVITSLDNLSIDDFLKMAPSKSDPQYAPDYDENSPIFKTKWFKVLTNVHHDGVYKLIGPNFEKKIICDELIYIYSNEGFIIFKAEDCDIWFNTNTLKLKRIKTN